MAQKNSKKQPEKLYYWSYCDPKYPLRNFQYIDVVRDKDGKLRSWQEYNKYSQAENFLDGSAGDGWQTNEKRSRF